MYTVEELQQQNQDIADLSQVLQVLVENPQVRGNPYACDLLSKFFDKVWMHLVFEDKSLYSDLLLHHDSEVVKIATVFHDSAKALKKRFRKHVKQWCHVEPLKAGETDAFQEEMLSVISDVMRRVKSENDEIIPLVKRLQQQPIAAQ
ncbi:MAG: hemerythrin domain-containing protein [Pseudomonadota bacterium]